MGHDSSIYIEPTRPDQIDPQKENDLLWLWHLDLPMRFPRGIAHISGETLGESSAVNLGVELTKLSRPTNLERDRLSSYPFLLG